MRAPPTRTLLGMFKGLAKLKSHIDYIARALEIFTMQICISLNDVPRQENLLWKSSAYTEEKSIQRLFNLAICPRR